METKELTAVFKTATDPILSQTKPLHSLLHYTTLHTNPSQYLLILSSHQHIYLAISLLLSMFPNTASISHACRDCTRPIHPIRLDLITLATVYNSAIYTFRCYYYGKIPDTIKSKEHINTESMLNFVLRRRIWVCGLDAGNGAVPLGNAFATFRKNRVLKDLKFS